MHHIIYFWLNVRISAAKDKVFDLNLHILIVLIMKSQKINH